MHCALRIDRPTITFVNIDRDHDGERDARIDAILEAMRTKAARRGLTDEPAPHQIGKPVTPTDGSLDDHPATLQRSRRTKCVTERQFVFEPDFRHEAAHPRIPVAIPVEGW